jgi:hypothetical protein
MRRKGEKQMKKKVSLLAVLSLVMSMFFGMSVFASSTHITLSASSLVMKQGDEITITASSDGGEIHCYDDGSAPGTFVGAVPQGGGSYLITICIGNTEPAGPVHFGFYLDGADAGTADLWVNVQDSGINYNGSYTTYNGNVMNANNGTPAEQAAYLDSAKQQFPYGFEFVTTSSMTQAIVVVDSTKKVGTLFQAGVALGKYMVKDANGMAYMQTFTQQVGYMGQTYIGVNVPNVYGLPLTVSISAPAKAQFLARGIYGLYLNGSFVPWP